MVKFNDDHKKEMGGDFIPEGTHKVRIVDVLFGTDSQQREYVEITVEDEKGRNGTAKMWFTTDAAINYTFNIMRGIFVHNAPADKKDEVRQQIDNLADSEALAKACDKVLIGKEAWYQVVKTDRTYEDSEGNVKNSYNRNIYGYEPSPKKVSADTEADAGKTAPIKTQDSAGNDVEIAEF